MSMFQDEVQKLRIQIVDYQETVSQMERHTQDLGSQLNAERNRADNAMEAVSKAEAERNRLTHELGIAHTQIQNYQSLEVENSQMFANLQKTQEHLDRLSESVTTKTKQMKEMKQRLDETEAENRLFRERVETVDKLLEALQTRLKTDALITEQLGLLNGG